MSERREIPDTDPPEHSDETASAENPELARRREENAELREQLARAREAKKTFKRQLRDVRRELGRVQESGLRGAVARRLDWVVEVDRPLVVIAQVQRSGGTLLAQLFDGHPECFVHPYELKWGRPAKWNWPTPSPDARPDAIFDSMEQDWLTRSVIEGFYQKQVDRRAYGEDGADFRHPFLFDPILHREIFRRQAAGASTTRDVLDAYLTGFFNAWLDYQGLYARPKRFTVGFIPRLQMEAESMRGFWADYPDGYLISLVRQPASWLASARRHDLGVPDEVDSLANLWMQSTEASLRQSEERPERALIVLFEDLVRDAPGTMGAICDRLGLSFDERSTTPTFNNMAILSDSSFEPASDVDSRVLHRYRRVLDADVIERVERRCSSAYERAREVSLAPAGH